MKKAEYRKDGLFNKWYSKKLIVSAGKNTIRILYHTINKMYTLGVLKI